MIQLPKHINSWLRRLCYACVGVFLLGLALVLMFWDEAQLVSPPATPLFEDRHGSFLAESDAEKIGFWSLEAEQATRVAACLIVVEDRRFEDHEGVDGRALLRALVHNLKGGPRQGASTLAMQVARLQGEHRRTFGNKLRELIIARLMVARHGREAILNHYLRIVPQGNRIHGVAYGARRYFQKPVQDLSWAESALLAALPKAPGRMNLYRQKGRKHAIKRAHRVIDLLEGSGELNRFEAARAHRSLDKLKIPRKETRPFNLYHAILNLEAVYGEGDWQKPIRTSLDLGIHDQVDALAHEAIEAWRYREAGNIACLVVDKNSGEVLSWLGSDFYDDLNFAGAIDYVRQPRSSGSTLKPFLFAHGLESGAFEVNSILADLPLNITSRDGHYTADNYDRDYLGPMLYRRALANSRNVPALHVLREVGVRSFYERLRMLGLAQEDCDPSHYGLGLAIGGLYVTLEDLVRAYGVLAAEGRPFQLSWSTKPKPPSGPRIFREDTARHLGMFLSDPQARLPSFPRIKSLAFQFPVAMKTGTSQGFRDGWAIGWSDRYVIGVWVGRADNRKMNRVGGMSAATLLKDLFTTLQPDTAAGMDAAPFAAPRGFNAVKLCPLSGEPATEHCVAPALEYFKPGTEPVGTNTIHKPFIVDNKTGHKPDLTTAPQHLVSRNHVVLPPLFAGWGATKGYGAPPISEHIQKPDLVVRSPIPGSRLRPDPDTPEAMRTLALRANVSPAVPEVVWYVNGEAYQRARFPYTVRWPLKKGRHTFQARFPHADIRSEAVTVTVLD